MINISSLSFLLGDDTAHEPYPSYDIPYYIASDLPKGESNSLVDLVYFDFFDALVLT